LRCDACEGDGHAERRGATGLGGFLLTLELRRELAEKLSLRAIKGGQNIEAILVALLEAAAKRW
jgi:hypothetical protein